MTQRKKQEKWNKKKTGKEGNILLSKKLRFINPAFFLLPSSDNWKVAWVHTAVERQKTYFDRVWQVRQWKKMKQMLSGDDGRRVICVFKVHNPGFTGEGKWVFAWLHPVEVSVPSMWRPSNNETNRLSSVKGYHLIICRNSPTACLLQLWCGESVCPLQVSIEDKQLNSFDI